MTVVFPTPSDTYDRTNESEFRREVRRMLEDISGAPTVATLVESPTLASGDNDNYALGDDTTLVRATTNAGGSRLTSIAGGAEGRSVRWVNLGSGTLTIVHQDGGASTAANRIITPDAADWVLVDTDVVDFEYDAVTDRWRLVEITPTTVTLQPRLTDITLFVDNNGVNDNYTVTWKTSDEVLDTYAIELVAVKNGLRQDGTIIGDPTPTGTQTWSPTPVGVAAGQTHMIVANLLEPGGDVVDTKVSVVLSV